MKIFEQSRYEVEETRTEYVTESGDPGTITVTRWPENHGVTVYVEYADQVNQTFSLTRCDAQALVASLQFLNLEEDTDA